MSGFAGATVPLVPLIAGPTGIGKTALALELARRLPFDIISADSMQVYRGLPVGTAQPTPPEHAAARAVGSAFHLCGDHDPLQPFDAHGFLQRCAAAHADIEARGRRPLYVGGTGLYLRALRWGLMGEEARDPALRARLQAELDQQGAAPLHARLAALDPPAAAQIAPSDALRIVRALEAIGASGRPWSQLQAQWAAPRARFPHLLLVLALDRATLRERIARRTRAMLAAGWVEETAALLASGVPRTAHCFKALGYAEIFRHLDGNLAADELERRIIDQTRQFARRQLIWLRRERPALWLSSDGQSPAQLAERVQNLLANQAPRSL